MKLDPIQFLASRQRPRYWMIRIIVILLLTISQFRAQSASLLVIQSLQVHHGLVRYSISGTVGPGVYVNLSGEVMVNGTSAAIPVMFTDNDMIGQLKYLTLTLEAGDGYQIGVGGTTTITVDDNDAEWRGTLPTRGANLGFVLTLEQLNGSPMAALSSDQLGFFPGTKPPWRSRF